MIPALIIDGILLAALYIANQFCGFELTETTDRIWRCIGWAVVFVTLVADGWECALFVFVVVAVLHKLVPTGWALAMLLIILII